MVVFVAKRLASYCDRILTSGGRNTPMKGAHVIGEIRSVANVVIAIAAGGIRSHNVVEVPTITGFTEILL